MRRVWGVFEGFNPGNDIIRFAFYQDLSDCNENKCEKEASAGRQAGGSSNPGVKSSLFDPRQ